MNQLNVLRGGRVPRWSSAAASWPRRTLYQVYIIYSVQKGQASSGKMYTTGQFAGESARFLWKMRLY